MVFQLINGKMVQVDQSAKVASYTWKMPNDNVKAKRNIMDAPMMPSPTEPKQGVYARSSLAVGIVAATAATGINPENGMFWEIFMQYIYPWFLDIANVFVAIKVAQAFYQENRGGSGSSSGSGGMGALVVHAKWLLLFHLIPFFVKLVDEVGRKMTQELG